MPERADSSEYHRGANEDRRAEDESHTHGIKCVNTEGNAQILRSNGETPREEHRCEVALDLVLVTAGASDLPFPDDELDALFSTMTFHEFAANDALAELARISLAGATVVIADWTATGVGDVGPPLDERFVGIDAEELPSAHGFNALSLAERPETFLLTAVLLE